MCTTPATNSAKAAPRRHSPPDVFPAVRRRASRPCSRMQSGPTAPSLMRSHFGRDFEADKLAAACVETVTTLLPDGTLEDSHYVAIAQFRNAGGRVWVGGCPDKRLSWSRWPRHDLQDIFVTARFFGGRGRRNLAYSTIRWHAAVISGRTPETVLPLSAIALACVILASSASASSSSRNT